MQFSPASVRDVVGALVALAEGGATGSFNLGGPQAFSGLELLEMLVRHIRVYVSLVTDSAASTTLASLSAVRLGRRWTHGRPIRRWTLVSGQWIRFVPRQQGCSCIGTARVPVLRLATPIP